MSLREGDRVRITLIKGNYRVKWIGDRVVILETEDGSGQFLTTVDNLDLNPLPQNPKINNGSASNKLIGCWRHST